MVSTTRRVRNGLLFRGHAEELAPVQEAGKIIIERFLRKLKVDCRVQRTAAGYELETRPLHEVQLERIAEKVETALSLDTGFAVGDAEQTELDLGLVSLQTWEHDPFYLEQHPLKGKERGPAGLTALHYSILHGILFLGEPGNAEQIFMNIPRELFQRGTTVGTTARILRQYPDGKNIELHGATYISRPTGIKRGWKFHLEEMQ